MVDLVYTSCACIWVLLTAAGDIHSWQLLERPPATHPPKPLAESITAVKQGISFPERISKTLGREKNLREAYKNLTCILQCNHVT